MTDRTDSICADAPQHQPEPAATMTFPLLSYLNTMADELRLRVPTALEQWDPEAIHQSRVATRRLKAALVLL
jgi:CHAD domain-containing protein